MKKLFFKYCIGIPPEQVREADRDEAAAKSALTQNEEYNKFIRAIKIYDICEIRKLKKNNKHVEQILELISPQCETHRPYGAADPFGGTPEYRMLYLALVSIIRDFDNISSNLGLKKFIIELLYLDCKTKVNNTMLKIVKRANCILKDGKVMCYKSDNLNAYLITLD